MKLASRGISQIGRVSTAIAEACFFNQGDILRSHFQEKKNTKQLFRKITFQESPNPGFDSCVFWPTSGYCFLLNCYRYTWSLHDPLKMGP